MWWRLVLFLLLIPLAGAAIPAHVTDKLLVGLYGEADTSTEPLQLLPSGTPLEILERRTGLIRIKLADGTQGWMESGYISEEKPARARLLETQAKLLEMRSTVAELEARVKEAELDQRASADIPGDAPVSDVTEDEASDTRLPADPPELLEEQDQLGLYWPWLAILLTAVLAFAAGVGLVDYRIRKRFGGLRF